MEGKKAGADRVSLIKTALSLNLNIKKNWKTSRIQEMVDAKLGDMNSKLVANESVPGEAEARSKTFCGYCPRTGKEIHL